MNQKLNFLKARKKLNLSQEEMALQANVSRETISNTERGKNMSYPYLLHLVELGYSKDWLLGNNECDMYSQKSKIIYKNDEELVQKAEKAESRILQLERKIMEVQSEMNIIYKFLFKHSDKLDLSELELSLGKPKLYLKSDFVTAKIVRMPKKVVTNSNTSVLAQG